MSVTYQIRLDEETKRESFEAFRELGLTPADGIRIYLRTVAKTKSIPFQVKVPNETTRKTMDDTDRGVGLYRAKGAEDLFRKLGM